MPRAAVATVNATSLKSEIEKCRLDKRPRDLKFEGEPGLYLRVSAAGLATWSLVYKPKGHKSVCRYGLGRLSSVSVKDAREMAKVWMGKISQGIDPREVLRTDIETKAKAREDVERLAAEKAARITVQKAVELFIAAKVKAGRRATYHMNQMLQGDLVSRYGQKAIADLTRNDIEDIKQSIIDRGSPRAADNVLSTIRSLLSWSMGPSRRYVRENVAARFERVQKSGEGIRERKLSAAELRALWLALERDDIGMKLGMRRIFKLTILLGQRINEIGGMRKSELTGDLMLWTIPGERMKAKKTHILPLPPMAREIVKQALDEAAHPHIFAIREGKPPITTSMSHAMSKLQTPKKSRPAILEFENELGEPSAVKLHDLRRTMATGMQHLGVRIEVIKAALAHTALDDVTRAHYAQSSLCKEVREALTLWQATIARIVRGEDPFAFRTEDAAEMERRILGQDQRVTVEPPSAPNVVPLRAVG